MASDDDVFHEPLDAKIPSLTTSGTSSSFLQPSSSRPHRNEGEQMYSNTNITIPTKFSACELRRAASVYSSKPDTVDSHAILEYQATANGSGSNQARRSY